MPELGVTRAVGPYNLEFMTEVTKEIVSLYKVDGIFGNRWSGSGICYCERCQRNFNSATGLELPRTANLDERTRRAHREWREQRLFGLWGLWDPEDRHSRSPRAGNGQRARRLLPLGHRPPLLGSPRNGPLMMKGPIREFVPTPPRSVSIRPPNGRKARKVRLLVSGQAPRVQEASGSVSLTIPPILNREVVAIDL